jgi:hypothetical protein
MAVAVGDYVRFNATTEVNANAALLVTSISSNGAMADCTRQGKPAGRFRVVDLVKADPDVPAFPAQPAPPPPPPPTAELQPKRR